MAIPNVKLNNGLLMPQFGLGTYHTPTSGDKPKIYQSVRDAIAVGYRHIDTAEVYEIEDEVGRAVNDAIKAGEVRREELFITTKIFRKFGRDQVVPSLRESLKKLDMDYVDLYLIHYPCPIKGNATRVAQFEFDDELDIFTETWPAMEECVTLGLTKSIGVSNFNSQQIDGIMKVAKIRPVTNQVECHPFLSQRKLIDHCARHGITITSYSPMGGSPVDADYAKAMGGNADYEVRKNLFENELINQLAKKYGKTAGQILLRYHIDRGLIVIPKSVTKSRIEENRQIFDFKFTKEELEQLEALNMNLRYAHCKDIFGASKNYPFNIEY